ncbi:MAG: YqaJ viral recombinase family protein, partial [Oscillospiraceae bacterium]
CATRGDWLSGRTLGIGASDAAAVLGISPWKSNVELWEEKTGLRTISDISESDVVKYGKESEEYIRALFSLDFPKYCVEYHEFDMLFQSERPWLFATLDGELTEKDTGKLGVLEIKTTEIMRHGDWSKWRDGIPCYYYAQVVHQFAATGCDFLMLRVHIKERSSSRPDGLKVYVRHYYWERAEVLADIEILVTKETEFHKSMVEKRRPNQILPEI